MNIDEIRSRLNTIQFQINELVRDLNTIDNSITIEPYKVVAAYKSVLGDSLGVDVSLTAARISNINMTTRMNNWTINNWLNYLNKVKETPFLLGDNKHGWKASFQWLIDNENVVKVREGIYTKEVKVDVYGAVYEAITRFGRNGSEHARDELGDLWERVEKLGGWFAVCRMSEFDLKQKLK